MCAASTASLLEMVWWPAQEATSLHTCDVVRGACADRRLWASQAATYPLQQDMRCVASAAPQRPNQAAGSQTGARSSQFQEALLDLHNVTPTQPMRLSNIPGFIHACMCLRNGLIQDTGSCHTYSARGFQSMVLPTDADTLLGRHLERSE